MFGYREAIVDDILVVMFLVAVCTIIYGIFIWDAVAVGIGAVILLLFFCLWIKKFRKR